MPTPPPHFDPSHSLSERERKVARRVRRALHLSPSMSEEEVAAELYGTFVVMFIHVLNILGIMNE